MPKIAYKTPDGPANLEFHYADNTLSLEDKSYPCHDGYVWIKGRKLPFWAHKEQDNLSVWLDGEAFNFSLIDPRKRLDQEQNNGNSSGIIKAQMPGKILKVEVEQGQLVKKGQNLLVMESMKMELNLDAPFEGKIESLKVSSGQLVAQNEALIKIASLEEESPS